MPKGALMRKRIPRNKRVPFRFIVRYGMSRPLGFRSFIADLSDTGLYLSTNRVFNPGTHVYMTIEVYDESFDCEGTVKWAKRVPPGLERITRCGMGIEFTTVPQRLLDIYMKKVSKKK
jgi:Tfp pilus assembly protein PilZ